MTSRTDAPNSFGKQLSRPEFEPLDRETLKGLIRKINDKSQSVEERDDAKNRLLLAHARLIYGRVFDLTDGRIGINDRQSELFDDAFVYLKERFSEVADSTERGISLTSVVCERLVGWFGDKIRRADGQTLKRGKGRNHEPVTALAEVEGVETWPEENLIREETLAIIKANVFDAVAELEWPDQLVVISRFGLGGGDELSMNEVATLLGMTLNTVKTTYRRAADKLKKWLTDHEPNSE